MSLGLMPWEGALCVDLKSGDLHVFDKWNSYGACEDCLGPRGELYLPCRSVLYIIRPCIRAFFFCL